VLKSDVGAAGNQSCACAGETPELAGSREHRRARGA
jgi:hypothetical protein